MQQFIEALGRYIPPRCKYCGCELWSGYNWAEEFEDDEIFVCTDPRCAHEFLLDEEEEKRRIEEEE